MDKLTILLIAIGFILWVALAAYIASSVPVAADNYAKHVVESLNNGH